MQRPTFEEGDEDGGDQSDEEEAGVENGDRFVIPQPHDELSRNLEKDEFLSPETAVADESAFVNRKRIRTRMEYMPGFQKRKKRSKKTDKTAPMARL